MGGHARLSASKTKQWSICPGSLAVLEAQPELEGTSGYYADMGTCAHALVERCLREGSEPVDYDGRLIKIMEDNDGNQGTSILKKNAKMPPGDASNIFEVDQDMYEAVECMTNYVRYRCVELGLVSCGPMGEDNAGLAAAVAELVERGVVRLEVNVTPLPDRDDTGGTGDVVIDVWPEMIEVVDYKNGSGVYVSVEENEQLRSYALGTLNEFDSDDYEYVRYTICQPRCIESPPNGISPETMTVDDLKRWGRWLSGRADHVDAARALVAAGGDMDDLYKEGLLSVGEDGSACRWCELAANCPAALAKNQELACTDFEDEPAVLEPVNSENHLAMLVPWMPFVAGWAKTVLESAEAVLMQGGSVTGQKLIQGSANRKMKPAVTDKMLVKYLNDEGVTDEEKMYNARTIRTGPQLEKLLPKKDRAAFSEEFMHKPPGKIKMVPESDDGEAVTVTDAADDFPDEEDET
ncbi:MAG: DUF2800 domain-containing protein [Nitrospiraceae bacterium]